VAQSVILGSDNAGPGIAIPDANFTPLNLTFQTQPSGDIGAEIVLNYMDAGAIQLHANFNILLDDGDGPASGDYMHGVRRKRFVVRAFGLDVGFTDQRRSAGAGYKSKASYAEDHEDAAFQIAGAPFAARRRAVA